MTNTSTKAVPAACQKHSIPSISGTAAGTVHDKGSGTVTSLGAGISGTDYSASNAGRVMRDMS